MRYRRIKTGILNNAFMKALTLILIQIMLAPSLQLLPEQANGAAKLAFEWLSNEAVKRRIASLLEEAGLDESAIEAQAYTLVADDLEKADRMLSSAQEGRDKALRAIAKYRKIFADLLERSSNRVLAADEAPGVVN